LFLGCYGAIRDLYLDEFNAHSEYKEIAEFIDIVIVGTGNNTILKR
jgi:hypothetical protein